MVEIHVVTNKNAACYQSELESYYRWRHVIYVEERGWKDLRKPDGLERDQFDNDKAVHLLAIRGGEVVGGTRLISANNPTLANTVFADLHEREPAPTDPQTIDWTRMFVVPAHRRGTRCRSVAGALFCGVMEYCISQGAHRVGGIMETYWLTRFTKFKWTVRPLGLPTEIEGSMTFAVYVNVSPEALANVRAMTSWNQSVLAWDRLHVAHNLRRVA